MHTSGLCPAAAAPTPMPTIAASATGVSRTRDAPNFLCRPSNSRYDPPNETTSCPSTKTRGPSSITSSSEQAIASRKNSRLLRRTCSDIGQGFRGCWIRRRVGKGQCGGNRFRDVARHVLFPVLIQFAAAFQQVYLPPDRALRTYLLQLRRSAGFSCRRRIAGETSGNAFDKRRSIAGAYRCNGLMCRFGDHPDIHAVDALRRNLECRSDVRQVLRRQHRTTTRGDRELIVAANEQQRQSPDRSDVQGFMKRACTRCPIAEKDHNQSRTSRQLLP